MTEDKIFLLISKDWKNVMFSTEKSRPGYNLSKEYSGTDYGLLKELLSELKVQENTPLSALEYNTRIAENLRPKKLEVESLITKDTPPSIEKFVRDAVDNVDEHQRVLDVVWWLGREIAKHDKEKKDKGQE